MVQTLPVSRLINVDVNLTPLAAQAQDLSTLLILGNSDVIDVVELRRTYTTIDEVANDFGTSAPEYLAALLWFEQAPQPNEIMIGRWAQTATKGLLNCATLASANQLIAHWTAINNGSFKVTVDGGVQQSLGGLNFTGVTNLNGVATIINAVLTGALCTYNAVFQRFQIESLTTGPSSSVSFLVAGSGGTDISDDLAGRSTDSGAYVANGIAAQAADTAVEAFDSAFGQTWYAVVLPTAVDADHLLVAPLIEASDNKHIYGVTTQEAGVLSSVSTTDIAYLLKAHGYLRTVVQYSSSNAYAVCSLLGRILTVNYNGNNTVITLMYKQEPGIVAENLSSNQVDALEAKNCNVFVAYNNNTAIIEQGKVCSGAFLDEVTGTDWLAVTIMNEVYNLLYTSPTKIPQTDAGVHLIVTRIEAVCSQGVINDLLAPGTWNSQGFGTLQSGDFLAKGFYVYAAPVASQFQADREARKAPVIQVAAKLAGAVHTVDIIILVNR